MKKQTQAVRHVSGVFPEADHVAILGQFNNWSTTATPMKNLGQGVWEAWLPLEAAMLEVCFFVWDHGRIGGRLASEHRIEHLPAGLS